MCSREAKSLLNQFLGRWATLTTRFWTMSNSYFFVWLVALTFLEKTTNWLQIIIKFRYKVTKCNPLNGEDIYWKRSTCLLLIKIYNDEQFSSLLYKILFRISKIGFPCFEDFDQKNFGPFNHVGLHIC